MTLEDTELLETEEEPVAYYRGLNNYLYYLFCFFLGGGILYYNFVYWAPKPHSNC